MAQTFYGPWKLSAWLERGVYVDYFTIAGSDACDGQYLLPDDGSRFDLIVTGQEWTIQVQSSGTVGGPLFDHEPQRGDAFVPYLGRFAVLAPLYQQKPFGPGAHIVIHGLDIQLESTDPLLSPPWVKPFDFTRPDAGSYGFYRPPHRQG